MKKEELLYEELKAWYRKAAPKLASLKPLESKGTFSKMVEDPMYHDYPQTPKAYAVSKRRTVTKPARSLGKLQEKAKNAKSDKHRKAIEREISRKIVNGANAKVLGYRKMDLRPLIPYASKRLWYHYICSNPNCFHSKTILANSRRQLAFHRSERCGTCGFSITRIRGFKAIVEQKREITWVIVFPRKPTEIREITKAEKFSEGTRRFPLGAVTTPEKLLQVLNGLGIVDAYDHVSHKIRCFWDEQLKIYDEMLVA